MVKYAGIVLVMCIKTTFAVTSLPDNESIIIANNSPGSKLSEGNEVSHVAASSVSIYHPSAISGASTSAIDAIAARSDTDTSSMAGPRVRVNTALKLKRHKFTKPNVRSSQLANMTFDFNYFGDISGVPLQLRNYDTRLSILHALGTKKPINIGISLQGTKINDVIDAIAVQTNDQVHLVFNTDNDSVRLNYTGAIDVGNDAISESLKWQQGGAPRPVLKQDGVVRFPYGEYQPVVTCQPLNLCDIELQAGEDVQGIVIGDSERWNEGDNGIPLVYSGVAGSLIPHLVLKPSQGGLDTTLMVTTSRRTYMFKIKSSFNGYVARVGFYYPAEMIQKFTENKSKLKNSENDQSQSVNPDIKMPLIDLRKVNYAYKISGGDYVWKPTQVFDDGISVYIQLPDSVGSRSLPGLCILVDGDNSETKCEMVNFRFNDHFYIVDRLFNRAKLINGYDDYMQTIMIKRKPDKPGFWSRLFS